MSAMSVVKQMEQMSISYGVDGVQGVSELLKHRTGRGQFRHRLLQVGRCQLGNTLLKQITQCAGVISPSLTALVMALIDWPIPNVFPFTHSCHVAIFTDNNRWNIRIWTHYDMVSQQTAFHPKLAPDLNP